MNRFNNSLLFVVLLMQTIVCAQQATPKLQLTSPPSTVSTTDTAVGSPYEMIAPKYPKSARRSSLQGAVSLRLTLNEKGHVTNVSVLSGDPELAKAAVRSVREWRYVPYFRDGQPIQVTTMVTINFKLTDTGQPDISAAFAHYEGTERGPVFKVGNGVSAPKVIHTEDPVYDEKARRDKYQGTCVLTLIVGSDGKPYNIRVARHLGEGLDEKAIEAVSLWRFSPATKDGKPVAVVINVEVQFRLY